MAITYVHRFVIYNRSKKPHKRNIAISDFSILPLYWMKLRRCLQNHCHNWKIKSHFSASLKVRMFWAQNMAYRIAATSMVPMLAWCIVAKMFLNEQQTKPTAPWNIFGQFTNIIADCNCMYINVRYESFSIAQREFSTDGIASVRVGLVLSQPEKCFKKHVSYNHKSWKQSQAKESFPDC